MNERSYRIWIDADGTVWLEDPDPAVAPLASSIGVARSPEAGESWLPLPVAAHTSQIEASLPWPTNRDALWRWHNTLVSTGVATPGRAPSPHLLDLKHALAADMMRACQMCEHRCLVDRTAGERGKCGVGSISRFASACIHTAEEAEIAPSFNIALTGCSWHCSYCHTYDLINHIEQGYRLDSTTYTTLLRDIHVSGAKTLSFVGGNPDHHLLAVLDFIRHTPNADRKPVVWNTNMYGTPELFALLDGVVDVYLGDFRYGPGDCDQRLSGVAGTWDAVTRNWRLAVAQKARCIVRVLVIPGHLDCCVHPILEWLANHLPTAPVSLLEQYHATYRVSRFTPEINRRPTPDELRQAHDWVAQFSLSTVSAADSRDRTG